MTAGALVHVEFYAEISAIPDMHFEVLRVYVSNFRIEFHLNLKIFNYLDECLAESITYYIIQLSTLRLFNFTSLETFLRSYLIVFICQQCDNGQFEDFRPLACL